MLKHHLLKTFATIVEQGSFEEAARQLFITQSAVSQRLKMLENEVGEVLVVRVNPAVPTEKGRLLLRHYRQLQWLDSELMSQLKGDNRQKFRSLRIGLNDDSLATWFLPAMQQIIKDKNLIIDIIVDDQSQTFELLRKGEVMAGISAQNETLQGCQSKFLMDMKYIAVASPGFEIPVIDKNGTLEAFADVATVVFDRDDWLTFRFIEQLIKSNNLTEITAESVYETLPIHYIPSSEAFVEAVRLGLAWGVVPEMQVKHYLQNGELIQIYKETSFYVSLYWHNWRIHEESMTEIFDSLSKAVQKWQLS